MPIILKVLRYYLLAYPILWLLGIDGFVWMFLLPISMISFFQGRSELKFNYLLWFGFMLLISGMLISAIFIKDPIRYLTWFRDVYIIITMFNVLFAVQRVDTLTATIKLIKPISYLIILSCIIGLLAVCFHLNFTLVTPAKFLLPNSLTTTDFGNRLVTKMFFSETWFANMSLPRLKSIFTYATSYAVALSLYLVYFITVSNKILSRSPLFSFTIIILACLNLLLTLTRVPIIALLTSLFIYFLISSKNIFTKIIITIFIGLCIFFIFKSNIFDYVVNLRGGSYTIRTSIYIETIDAFLNNPLGYGTYLDVADLPLPLGSHSTWLAFVFKYGILGITGFIFILLVLFFRVKNWKIRLPNISLPIIICMFMISLTEEIYLDSLTGLISMVLLGTALSAEKNIHSSTFSPLRPKKSRILTKNSLAHSSMLGKCSVNRILAFKTTAKY